MVDLKDRTIGLFSGFPSFITLRAELQKVVNVSRIPNKNLEWSSNSSSECITLSELKLIFDSYK